MELPKAAGLTPLPLPTGFAVENLIWGEGNTLCKWGFVADCVRLTLSKDQNQFKKM